jgi:2-haloacid dehalogenase
MRIMALSNGARSATQGLLRSGGLEDLVSHVVSVDDVRIFKPRREVYDHAARTAGVVASRIALVAVHAWDISGAKAAGFTTAYVAAERPFSPVMRTPDLEADSLSEAARKLVML